MIGAWFCNARKGTSYTHLFLYGACRELSRHDQHGHSNRQIQQKYLYLYLYYGRALSDFSCPVSLLVSSMTNFYDFQLCILDKPGLFKRRKTAATELCHSLRVEVRVERSVDGRKYVFIQYPISNYLKVCEVPTYSFLVPFSYMNPSSCM